jgi:two-component system, LytTR family, sensor kinase
MSKKKIIYIHVFIWLFAIFANLPYANLGNDTKPQFIVAYIIGFLYLMAVFYFFYLVMAPYFLEKKKLGMFFGLSFLVVLIMPFIGYTILLFSKALFEGSFSHFYSIYTFKMHMSGYFPVLTASISGSFFAVIINWFKTMNQKIELDKEKLSIELDLLKSKLNPHFLFNTLNNIDSLIHQDSDKASEALIRLSDIMRYLTYETVSDMVSLSKEVDYINNFIELNRMRIRTPDYISFDVSGDQNAMIAPALFVPLLENAFKFATFRNTRPCIEIKLLSQYGIVTFSISNQCERSEILPAGLNSGSGLKNLRKRLELTYPGRHELEIKSSDFVYLATLIIDTNADKLHSN